MATPSAGTSAPAKDHWAWAALGKVWEKLSDATESDKIEWARIHWEDLNFRRRFAGALIGLIFFVLWAVAFVGYSLWDSSVQELCRWPIIIGLTPLFIYLKLYEVAGAIVLTLLHKVIEPFDPNRLNLVNFLRDRDSYQFHMKAYLRPLLVFSFAMFIWPVWWMACIAFLAGGITYYMDHASGPEEQRRHGMAQAAVATTYDDEGKVVKETDEKNSMSQIVVGFNTFKLHMWNVIRFGIAIAGLGLIAFGDAMPRVECSPGGAKFNAAYASTENSGWTVTWLNPPPVDNPAAEQAFAEIENKGEGILDTHFVSNEMLTGALRVPNATAGCYDPTTGVNDACVTALTVAPYTEPIVRAAVNQARCWEASGGMMVDEGCLRNYTGENERLRSILKARLGIALDPTCWYNGGTLVKDRCIAAIARYHVLVDYRPLRWYQQILHPTSWGTDGAVSVSVRDLADQTPVTERRSSTAIAATGYLNNATVVSEARDFADPFMHGAESGVRARVYGQCLQNVTLGADETAAVWKMEKPDAAKTEAYWAAERRKNPSLQRAYELDAKLKALQQQKDSQSKAQLAATSGENEYQVMGRKWMRYMGLPMWVFGLLAILVVLFLLRSVIWPIIAGLGAALVVVALYVPNLLKGKGGGADKGGGHAKPAKAAGGGGHAPH